MDGSKSRQMPVKRGKGKKGEKVLVRLRKYIVGRFKVSDHRGSNSQVIDFERVEIYPIFTAKIKNPEKSNA